ncbi:MAG: sugar ABC transporter substrate-binding protein [Oscillospiraceae bacterium]
MSKLAKRTLAIVLALSMCLALAACGSKDKGGSEEGGTSYYIGFNTWGAGTATFDFMADVTTDALDTYGATYSRASDDHMADKELQNIQNFISAEVDGIIMQSTAEPTLPKAAEECAKAKIPFVLAVFTGADEDRAKVREENEYYLGSVNADMYEEGYIMGKAAAEDGHKTAVLLGGNVGDAHFEMRIAGFTKAFVEEGGGKILEEARCTSPAEGQEKANAMLSANKTADCLYAMVGDYVPGAVNAMETLGISMPIYVTNANTDAIEYIRNGKIAAATTGNDLVCAVAAALMINYLDGHQILDNEGKAPELKSVGFRIDADNVDDYERLFLNNIPFTDEVLKTLVYRYNENVTYDTFADFMANHLNLESLVADNK